MTTQDLNYILSIGISASIGATLGILRSKIFASKIRNVLYIIFYIFSCLLLLFAIYAACVAWSESITIIIASILSSLGLAATTYFFLVIKDTYKTSELSPIVNRWTAKADKAEIKLFGGDLDFFGRTPGEMAGNSQY